MTANQIRKTGARLYIGEKVSIAINNSSTYPTLLEDIAEDGKLIISVPLRRGIPIVLKKEQIVTFYYFRDNGMFSFETRVVDFIINGNLRLIILERLSDPVKRQRRESFRLPVQLQAEIRPYAGGRYSMLSDDDDDNNHPWETVALNNISETGLSLNTEGNYQAPDRLQIKLELPYNPEESEAVEVIGTVRQVELLDYNTKTHRLGIEFIVCSDEARRLISRFIMVRQQQMLKDQKEATEEDEF